MRTTASWASDAQRHGWFGLWYLATAIAAAGALLALWQSTIGIIVGLGWFIVQGLANHLRIQAGVTTRWGSAPRLRDLPIVAAHREDPGTWWDWWRIPDLVLLASSFAILIRVSSG